MISNMQVGSSQRSSGRFVERKTISCFSQDRSSVTSAQTKANLSYGGPNVSLIPQNGFHGHSQSSSQSRASTALHSYGQQAKSPVLESKARRLQKFEKVQQTYYDTQIDEVDAAEARDPQACAEYAVQIFEHLKEIERMTLPSSGYMEKQEDINEKMRAILIDWLVEVHLKFRLVPESLFLTVNLIDRYLEKEQVNRQKLQLIGVTAMLIACKYEEIYPPIVKDFVYITDNAYTKEEILEQERRMLTMLDFDIQTTSSFRFLERDVKVAKADSMIMNLSRYLLELCLVNYKMLRYTNSNLAASALYLSLKMTKHAAPWTDLLTKHSQFTEAQIRPCAKELFVILQDAQTSSLQAVKKKFSLPKFGEVSKIRLEHSSSSGNNQKGRSSLQCSQMPDYKDRDHSASSTDEASAQ